MKANQILTSLLVATALLVASCSTPRTMTKNSVADDVYNSTAQARVYKPAPSYQNRDQERYVDTAAHDPYGSSDSNYDMDYASRIDRFYYGDENRGYFDPFYNYYGNNNFGGIGFNDFGMGLGGFYGNVFNDPFNTWGPYSQFGRWGWGGGWNNGWGFGNGWGGGWNNGWGGGWGFGGGWNIGWGGGWGFGGGWGGGWNNGWGGGWGNGFGGGWGGGWGGGNFIGRNDNYRPRPTRASGSANAGMNGVPSRGNGQGNVLARPNREGNYNPSNGRTSNAPQGNRPDRSNTRTESRPPARESYSPPPSNNGNSGSSGSSGNGSSSGGGGGSRPSRGGGRG